jgi:hypothetical protein
VYPLIDVNQRLGKQVPAPADAVTTEELLDDSFSVQSVTYQRRVCESVVYPLIDVNQRLGKQVPVASDAATT